MAAPLITGYDCSLTVGETVFDDVVASFELSFDTESLTYNVLSGPRAAGGSESGSLNLTWAYDSGETPSLYDALWTAKGTPIAYVATAGNSTYTGVAIAVRPGLPATAGSIVECSVELALDGMPVQAPVVVKAASK